MSSATASGPRPANAATSRRPRNRVWWKTALGVLFTAAMLFPVYWMVNVSLTRDRNMRKATPDLLPIHGTLEGYRLL